MKALFAALLLALPAYPQMLGELTDTPQHVIAVGAGIGPSTKDYTGFFAVGEKITGGTYSYSSVTFVPALPVINGKKMFQLTPTAHTGIQQIVFQSNRWTVAVDGGAGVSMPTPGTSSFNFSGTGAALIAWRINSALQATNHYIAIRPSVTQTPYGPVVAIAVGWAQGMK